jgi:Ca2+-dependent lipid-binding protein
MRSPSHRAQNLNPEWNASVKWVIEGKEFKPSDELVLTIYDRDRGSADDPMGEVRMTLRDVLTQGPTASKWYPVQKCNGCSNATGDLQLKISINVRKALSLSQKESLPIPPTATAVAVGLGWDPLPGGKAIDLDTSCVCVSFGGQACRDSTRLDFHRLDLT